MATMTVAEYNAKFGTKAKTKARKGGEDSLQREVARLLDHSGFAWCHVPNGGQRSAIAGAKLKAQGVKRGVPDILIFDPEDLRSVNKRNGFGDRKVGLAIELKVSGKPTPQQFQWHDDLRSRGWRVEVCYSIDEVIKVLESMYPVTFVRSRIDNAVTLAPDAAAEVPHPRTA
jgi:hypothetical protein